MDLKSNYLSSIFRCHTTEQRIKVHLFSYIYSITNGLVAWGLQVVGNSKTSPGAYKYMDLMFSEQDNIHQFASTGKASQCEVHMFIR